MATIELNADGPYVPASEPYSTDDDVRNSLGNVRDRLPTWVSIPTFRATAHATILDRLSRVYPDGIPTFGGAAGEVVRYAEAKLAAAEILEAIRVNLPDLGDAPDRLREDAFRAVDDGVVGYPAGSTDTGSPSSPGQTSTPGPRVSSFTPLSAFPDPYGLGREGARFE